jgi:hypothetical protein
LAISWSVLIDIACATASGGILVVLFHIKCFIDKVILAISWSVLIDIACANASGGALIVLFGIKCLIVWIILVMICLDMERIKFWSTCFVISVLLFSCIGPSFCDRLWLIWSAQTDQEGSWWFCFVSYQMFYW